MNSLDLNSHSLIRKIYEVTFDVNLNRFTLTRPFSQNVDESRQLGQRSRHTTSVQLVKICTLIVILSGTYMRHSPLTHTVSLTFIRIKLKFQEFSVIFAITMNIFLCLLNAFAIPPSYYLIAPSHTFNDAKQKISTEKLLSSRKITQEHF